MFCPALIVILYAIYGRSWPGFLSKNAILQDFLGLILYRIIQSLGLCKPLLPRAVWDWLLAVKSSPNPIIFSLYSKVAPKDWKRPVCLLLKCRCFGHLDTKKKQACHSFAIDYFPILFMVALKRLIFKNKHSLIFMFERKSIFVWFLLVSFFFLLSFFLILFWSIQRRNLNEKEFFHFLGRNFPFLELLILCCVCVSVCVCVTRVSQALYGFLRRVTTVFPSYPSPSSPPPSRFHSAAWCRLAWKTYWWRVDASPATKPHTPPCGTWWLALSPAKEQVRWIHLRCYVSCCHTEHDGLHCHRPGSRYDEFTRGVICFMPPCGTW